MANDERLDVTLFIKAMKEMLTHTHEIKQVRNCYNYTGPDITHSSVLAMDLTIKDSVTARVLKEHKEQKRDFLDIILMKIYQMGYSQMAAIKEKEINRLYEDVGKYIMDKKELREENKKLKDEISELKKQLKDSKK